MRTPEMIAKFKKVHELRETMGVKPACKKVGVNPSNYYSWREKEFGKSGITRPSLKKNAKLQPVVMHVNAPVANKYAVVFMDLASIKELMA